MPRRLGFEPLESRRLLAVGSDVTSAIASDLDFDLAFVGVAQPSATSTNAGLLMAFDSNDASGVWIPLGRPLGDTNAGFSGLAFTTPRTLVGSVRSDGLTASRLVSIDLSSTETSTSLPIRAGGQDISIGDLAVNPTDGLLYGIQSGGGSAGQLYRIDPQSGEAFAVSTPPAVTAMGLGDGLAFGADGTLYVTGSDQNDGLAKLFLESPAGSQRVARLSEPLLGLAIRPDDGALVGSLTNRGVLAVVDPQAAAPVVPAVIEPDSADRGILGDVAFPPPSPGDGLELVHYEEFEQGTGGYVADNTGAELTGLWHLSLGRRDDGLVDHSPNHAWYYGAFESSTGGGRYTLPGHRRGTVTSPEIELPDCGTSVLSFSYLLDVRDPIDADFVEVWIQYGDSSGAIQEELILQRADGSLPETGNLWQTATADLSAFAGRTIRVQFLFDTGGPVDVDPEGWYVDDVAIVGLPCPEADVSVTKSVDDETPEEGQEITYTITASNSPDSNATATTVIVTDNLPDGVTFVSADATEGQYDAETDSWSGLELSPGETQTLTLVAVVDAGTAGQTLVNTAVVTADQPDPDPDNNGDTATVIVNSVDVSVAKVVDDETPNELQTIVYTITASNSLESNAPATGVSVTDNLPDGVTLDSFDATEGDYDPETDTWSGLELDPGETQTLTLTAIVDAGTAGQTLVNTAVITADETDPDPSNNQDTATAVVNSVDLSVTKTVDDETPNELQTIVYTITASNSSESNAPATTVSVTDNLPDGVTLDSFDATEGDYDPETDTWSGLELDAGETQTLTLTVIVDAGTAGETLINTAVITGDQTDPDPSNNQDTATAVVNSVDLALTKTVDDETPNEGQLINYVITVTNSPESNATATGVTVIDTLYGSFDVPDLAPGDSFVIEIPITIEPGTAGQEIVNVATVTGNETDPDPSNNQDTATVVVSPSVLQFITPMSVFRPDGPFVRPPFSRTAISGYVWHDQNGDGSWAAGEPGINGVMVYVDLDGNNQRDVGEPAFPSLSDGTHDGAFWFSEDQFLGFLPGTFTLRVDLPAGDSPTFPGPPEFEHEVSIDVGSPSIGEFETAEPPNFGIPQDFVGTPPADAATIRGYKWNDLDQDGQWDADEEGRAGWRVYIDTNGNNLFDPDEPFAVTGADGRYVFAGLPPGTYTIREDRFGLSDGTFQVQRFPGPDPSRDADEHVVTVAAGEVLAGDFGEAEVPNFGTFDYSPFIRPADRPPEGWLTFWSDADEGWTVLREVLQSWQSFVVSNPTDGPATVTVTRTIAAPGDAMVTLYLDGEEAAWETPLEIAPGVHRLHVFYHPDVPGWTAGTSPAPHTFAPDDHLEVVLGLDEPEQFDVRLVGASTFDSDIFYDGVVDGLDFARLDNILRHHGTITPGEPGWDPTSDINVRLPNGALSTPEIGLGDFEPLNVELLRVRAPFVDLDSDNDSPAGGVDYSVRFEAAAVPVADDDAAFSNSVALEIDSLTATITNPVDAEQERLVYEEQEGHELVISGLGGIPEYETALRQIVYENLSTSPDPTPRIISFVAHGSSDDFGDQAEGNVARTTVFFESGAEASVASLAANVDAVVGSLAAEEPLAGGGTLLSDELLDVLAHLAHQEDDADLGEETAPESPDAVEPFEAPS